MGGCAPVAHNGSNMETLSILVRVLLPCKGRDLFGREPAAAVVKDPHSPGVIDVDSSRLSHVAVFLALWMFSELSK